MIFTIYHLSMGVCLGFTAELRASDLTAYVFLFALCWTGGSYPDPRNKQEEAKKERYDVKAMWLTCICHMPCIPAYVRERQGEYVGAVAARRCCVSSTQEMRAALEPYTT